MGSISGKDIWGWEEKKRKWKKNATIPTEELGNILKVMNDFLETLVDNYEVDRVPYVKVHMDWVYLYDKKYRIQFCYHY